MNDVLEVWFFEESDALKIKFKDRVEYRLKGKTHREDGPAIEWNSGEKEWYLNGQFHREGGPAIESADGTKMWYLYGMPHREDGPAVEFADGYKQYWFNGKSLDFITSDQMLVYYLKYGFLK